MEENAVMFNEQPEFIKFNGAIYKLYEPSGTLYSCPLCAGKNLTARFENDDNFEPQLGCVDCDEWFGKPERKFNT